MGKHRTGVQVNGTDCRRIGGGLVIGALASGAFALASLGSAGDANATCVSAGGWFTLGHGCTTTAPGDFALAIGPGATANASGGMNTAISWGAGANTTAEGVHNVAIGAGLGATAQAVGRDNTAIAIGDPSTGGSGGGMQNLAARPAYRPATAIAGAPVNQRADAADLAAQPQYSHNTAIAIGNGAQAGAGLGNNNFASAVGADSRATASGGDNNKALVFGDGSQAVAGQGAVAAPVPYLTSDVALSRPQSNNNIAIVRGNGSSAIAGGGDNNKAAVFGDGSHAIAGQGGFTDTSAQERAISVSRLPSNNNVAVVRGNDSTAYAGAVASRRSDSETRLALQPNSNNNNIATVLGNHSQAYAGDGNGNRARVIGSRSSAAAFGGHRTVTSVGDDVHKPAEEK
jgi:hypothetical protein